MKLKSQVLNDCGIFYAISSPNSFRSSTGY